VDRGQHWALWLHEWAVYDHRSFVSDPGLLAQYLDGGISTATIVENEDQVLAVLVRQGFTAREAMGAFQLVMTVALGWALHEVREQRARAAGRPALDDLSGILAGRDGSELVHLRRLVAEGGRPLLPGIGEMLDDVLTGLALRRGDDVDEMRAAVAGGG
jgi:hypothetical protein